MLTVERPEHKLLFTSFLFKKASVVVVGISRQIVSYVSLSHTKAKNVYRPFRDIFIKVQTTFV